MGSPWTKAMRFLLITCCTLHALVKSLHQKKPMQGKYVKSKGAQTHPFTAEEVKAYHLAWTHPFTAEEVKAYHLAWINYSPKSAKYNRATYSQHHIALHTLELCI